MKTIYKLIYKYKVWLYSKNVTKKKILQLVLFSYKHKVHCYDGLCYHLNSVEYDLGHPVWLGFTQFKGFSEPKHEGAYWWSQDDRKSRIKFLKDLIDKQD